MAISDDEALARARLAYPMAGKEWLDHAAKLEKAKAGIEELEFLQAEARTLSRKLTKMRDASQRLAKIRKADLQKECERRECCTRNRKIARLRDVLRKGEALKKSPSYPKYRANLSWRRKFDQAERAAIRDLAKLEAEQKAASNRSRVRSEIEALAATNRRAMFERGVIFDRMV